MLTYEPMAGEHVSQTAEKMVALAQKEGRTVQASFNDIALFAQPGDTASDVADFYNAESERQHKAYVESLEYKESQRQAEARQKQQDALLAGALSVAGPMAFSDEAGWRTFAEANTDPYGNAVVRFAERWARIMQTQIANGATIEECADDACKVADNEGITGFMFSCAVQVLAKTWIHGELLRRWHNLKTQIADEGAAEPTKAAAC